MSIDDLPPRIASKIELGDDGCWNWTACRDRQGYGGTSVAGRRWLAHRLVYTLMIGEIPPGLEVDHLCFVRHCVNPAHLEAVTHAENDRRRSEHQTVCRRAGHSLVDPSNVRLDSRGQRNCRKCNAAQQRTRYATDPAFRASVAAYGRVWQARRKHGNPETEPFCLSVLDEDAEEEAMVWGEMEPAL